MKKFIFSFFFVFLLTQVCVDAKNIQADSDWQKKMARLSVSLTDGFPYLYSPAEFRDAKNRSSVIRHLQQLIGLVSQFPTHSGRSPIGSVPLIENIRTQGQSDLRSALRLFEEKKFDESQAHVHRSIKNCFNCHTAYSVGPRFSTTNMEIMNIETHFVLGKGIVFSALRQFDGSLELIENRHYNLIDKKMSSHDNLVKMFLVVSLRTQQNFDRAIGFIQRLQLEVGLSPRSAGILKQWVEDIHLWKKLVVPGGSQKLSKIILDRIQEKSKNPDKNFVLYLLNTAVLHGAIAKDIYKNLPKEKVYQRLAETYAKMNFPPFQELPRVYIRACAAMGKSCVLKQ